MASFLSIKSYPIKTTHKEGMYNPRKILVMIVLLKCGYSFFLKCFLFRNILK